MVEVVGHGSAQVAMENPDVMVVASAAQSVHHQGETEDPLHLKSKYKPLGSGSTLWKVLSRYSTGILWSMSNRFLLLLIFNLLLP